MVLSKLISNVIQEFPKQSLWLFASVVKSTKSTRSDRGRHILDKLKVIQSTRQLFLHYLTTLFLRRLARTKRKSQVWSLHVWAWLKNSWTSATPIFGTTDGYWRCRKTSLDFIVSCPQSSLFHCKNLSLPVYPLRPRPNLRINHSLSTHQLSTASIFDS